MTISRFSPGTEVKIAYTGYAVQATVIEVTRDGERPHNGWVAVRQNIGVDSIGNVQEHNDFTDRPLDERPEYLAHEEFISLMDEPLKVGPLEAMLNTLTDIWARGQEGV